MDATSPTCARCGTALAAYAVACFKCGFAVEQKEKTHFTAGISQPTQVRPDGATILDDKWLLIEEIGSGGMGTVWLGKDLALDRKVAVKLLSESLSTSAEYIERFEREAKVMASLDHPNIVTLFAVGRRAGQPYIVMKFLEGAPLNAILNPRMTPQAALPLFRQMCDGLTAMHGRHILHRDLKPANLFVSPSGHLTILDLGIARQVGTSLTKTGIMFGTPAYMSPEQIAGEKGLDPRTDVYSAAAVLFEMITGHTPFEDEDEHNLLMAHIQKPPPDASTYAPDIPRALAIVIQRALSKRPADRFASTKELSEAVAGALGQAPIKFDIPSKGTKPLPNKAAAETVSSAPTEPGAPSPVTSPRRASGEKIPVARTRSRDDVPARAPKVPAPDSGVTPTVTPADSQPTVVPVEAKPTRAAEVITAPRPVRPHLGVRVATGIALAVFVLLFGYFMMRVIANTPKDIEPLPPKTKLNIADDVPNKRPSDTDTKTFAADSKPVVVPSALDDIPPDPSHPGAQKSVITQAEADDAADPGRKPVSGRPAAAPLLRKANPGELRLTATLHGLPVAATVFLNKRLHGKTPMYARMPTGTYKLKLLFPNIKPYELELLVDTSVGNNFEVELAPDPMPKDVQHGEDLAERARTQTEARAAEERQAAERHPPESPPSAQAGSPVEPQ